MKTAWQLVKKNGFNIAEAMKQAWRVAKLKANMAVGIVKFHFSKVNGEIREAFGTLSEKFVPASSGSGRKPSDSVQVYFDTEKGEFRCFKIANLLDY